MWITSAVCRIFMFFPRMKAFISLFAEAVLLINCRIYVDGLSTKPHLKKSCPYLKGDSLFHSAKFTRR